MPPNVYPDATIDELAAILARGVIRHLEQEPRAPTFPTYLDPLETSESGRDSLELPRTTVLSVLTGLQTRDSERARE